MKHKHHLILWVAAVALTAVMTAFQAHHAHADNLNDAISKNSNECAPLQEAYNSALVKPNSPEQTLKPGTIPQLTQALKDKGVFTSEQAADVKKKVEDAASFKELGEAFAYFSKIHCLSARINISRALITSIKNTKLTSAQKQDIYDLLRAQWRSEINTTSVGLGANSILTLTACENKVEKGFNIKCDNLKEFRTKLREFTRETQKESKKAMEQFTFTGRILWYWDKWVLKKDMTGGATDNDRKNNRQRRNSNLDLDRYFELQPVKNLLLDEYEKTKSLRAEFESFIL